MTEPTLTPAQLRAARELLKWSRERLAVRMGISCTTLARFENEGWYLKAFDASKAREAIEAAGIEFVAESGDKTGIRLR
jgi:transcriptional regulator with XRE-family HTH domain